MLVCVAARQVFNVVSEQLAAETAAALCASKLIFITGGQTLVDTRTKNVIQSMRVRRGQLGVRPSSSMVECGV